MRHGLFNSLAAACLGLFLAAVLGVWEPSRDHRSLIVFALAIPPVAWVVSAHRRDSEELRRIDHGLCRGCGYDIRTSTHRCPECGRPFQPHENRKIVEAPDDR